MFKLIVLCALVAVAFADVSHILRARPSGDERQATILRSEQEVNPDGTYQWAYQTDNGIAAQESGQVRELGPEQADKSAQGSFSWTSPEGEQVSITYLADANGYQPQGSHLPVPPPIPVAIQRALEYIRTHPEPQAPRRY